MSASLDSTFDGRVPRGLQPRRTLLQRAVSFCVYMFEMVMPDPFVIVILLTLLTAIAAYAVAPHGTPADILHGWYKGIFGIFTFAFQMVLVLVTGYALASAPVIRRNLERVSAFATTPIRAVSLVFLIGAGATFLNWGFGLVVGAMLSKEVAKRVKVDFAWLVAASYSSWVLWAFTGMSSSIALSIASPGNPLNLVEQNTHHIVGLSETVFSWWILVPGLAATALLLAILILIRPAPDDVIAAPEDALDAASEDAGGSRQRRSLAGFLERSRACAMVFVVGGAGYLAYKWSADGVALDINTVIFIFLLTGLALHGSAIAYVNAISSAARVTGPLLLQYPFYGGIMGIMSATGLAQVVSSVFIKFASGATLPFWSYIGSLFITLFIPSGGGHWAVQGPFTIPAAMQLGASLPGTSMAIATGELAASLLQPFWAIPVVAIAGVGIQRVLGFTLVCFIASGAFFAATYLLLVPSVAG